MIFAQIILTLIGCFYAWRANVHAKLARQYADQAHEQWEATRIVGQSVIDVLRHQHILRAGFADNGADIEARAERDAATLDCPACGGSGHFDDTHDESLLTSTVRGFTEGIGASEDHELIRHHFTRLGLPDDLVTTIMQRIVPGECREAFNEAIRQKIRTLDVTMHGDGESDLVEVLDAAIRFLATQRPVVAYGIFAMIPDEGWELQFPNYATRADADRMAGLFAAGTQLEVRPLYA